MGFTPLLLLYLLASFLSASDSESSFVEDDLPYLVDFYKVRHQEPELSLHEEKTAKALAGELRQIGFEVTEQIGGHGIVAMLRNGDGPQVLYRTDMDALPMIERTELPYASEVISENNGQQVGVMHSCGHDMHMTVWLGTARYLASHRDEWKGTLMLIGQPAEEIGVGAKAMLNDGLYQRFGVPDYGLALHCDPTLETGSVGLSDGYSMANTDKMNITIYGVGSHGAAPHMSIDPIVMTAMFVMELQTIVSRNVKPIDDAVVSVGAVNGGTQFNIIPSEVQLELTIRSYTDEVRDLVHRRIREIAEGVALAAGLPKEKYPKVFNFDDAYTPANFNEANLTQFVRASAIKSIGEEHVFEAEPMMVGEDFARYGRTADEVPTVLYWLGTVTEEKIAAGDLPGLHSPYYYPEIEETISTGVRVNVQTLRDLMPK